MTAGSETGQPNAALPETTADALERLVHQFADPLSFFRELIQNSIDAGTPEVEINFDYRDGLMTLHVDDFGEGMDRQIIDTRLTRLFSSGKEDDYTKIGRFGIGFVSVFALEPDAVVVDTSRGGESWRLLFAADRTFQRIVLDMPVDGTKIRIVKQLEEREFLELRQRTPEVVAYWCRHVEPRISVDGRVINRPLDVDSPCKVRRREEGTEVVVGYCGVPSSGTRSGEQIHGYYNRGITLLEEPAEGLTCFKIDSRYLEHTLTRDDVLRDANYDKAMAMVDQLVEHDLPLRLFQQFDAALSDKDPKSEELAQLGGLAASQLSAWSREGDLVSLERVGKFRLLRLLDGSLLSIEDARRALQARRVYRATAPSPVVEALVAQGNVIVRSNGRDVARRLLGALQQPLAPAAERTFCRPVRPSALPAGAEELSAGVYQLLKKHGAKISAVELASLGRPRSSLRRRVAITQASFGELTPMDEIEKIDEHLLARRRVVVLNGDHRTVKELLKLAPSEPELAAFLVVKLLYLRSELTPELDGRLAQQALETRWRRLPS